ncbi:MAG TPA: hypothetical protein VFU04_03085 [Solirubrobacterales bacterium]|nr:hypothetical protein [Solirubrobacterales bacterium]
MRLLSEVLGALGAGVLVFLVVRQLGFEGRRALVAVALVPLAVAGLLAVPALRSGTAELLDEREENASLTAGEAQVWPGKKIGLAVEFLGWVEERLPEGDTFHLVIGRAPDEVFVGGVGVRQAAILQWGLFQLAPHLAVEQSPKARDLQPGEGRNADWIVFYDAESADHAAVSPAEVLTHAPRFAMARTNLAR